MGYTVKNNTKVAVVRETTEGAYAAPASGADFVEILADGLDISPSREVLERNVLGVGLGKVAPRAGLKSVTGSLPVELKAGSTPGAAPEWSVMLESLMGARRSSASITTGVGHTSSVINVASTANLKTGDIVTIKQAGAYHTSPISSVVENASITLLVPMASAPADSVEIEAFSTFTMAADGHPSFSVSKYVENAILETATGSRCTSVSLENFTTAQIASLNFAFDGLDFGRELQAPAHTPSFDTSTTPTVIKARLYQNGTELEVNEFAFSIEATLGFIQNFNKGKTASRVTGRTVSGSMNPYKMSDSVANFDLFDKNEAFSLFVTVSNPLNDEGTEYHQSVSFYLPCCKVTSIGEGDFDGNLTDTLEFSGNTQNGTLGEVFITVC